MKFKKPLIAVFVFQTFISIQLVNPKTSAAHSVTYYPPRSNLQRIDIYRLNKSLSAGRLYIAMYSFTDKAIAMELIYLANHSVRIYVYKDDRGF